MNGRVNYAATTPKNSLPLSLCLPFRRSHYLIRENVFKLSDSESGP